ncbi:DUF4287 domain-containing protein [Achromobacter insolitus]|uniref:DUF4287 domain-containing protein n=1 Tax=Achromobacter insolitus TaxID=217204 RepID=UPI00244EF190|nr:DUF4287 domain-containing protein [Achromobacter insolitus]MDH3063424.1 DUF4287 domain-containing protein [Achromobacter insolitus]
MDTDVGRGAPKRPEHWFGILAAAREPKHMQLVAMLTSEHGLGHGHANALVAYHLARKKGG